MKDGDGSPARAVGLLFLLLQGNYRLLARPSGPRGVALRGCSAGFACAFRGGGAAAGVDEGVDELEDGALIGGGELFDLLQTFEEAGGLGGARRLDGGEAEQLIRGDLEGLGEGDEEGAGRLGAFAFVVGDHALREAGRVTELGLREATGLAEGGEAGTEVVEGAGLHGGERRSGTGHARLNGGGYSVCRGRRRAAAMR
jgi:hypothetical protein